MRCSIGLASMVPLPAKVTLPAGVLAPNDAYVRCMSMSCSRRYVPVMNSLAVISLPHAPKLTPWRSTRTSTHEPLTSLRRPTIASLLCPEDVPRGVGACPALRTTLPLSFVW